MKKLLTLLAGTVLLLGLTACGSPDEAQPEEQIDYEIAMVTNAGMIMDGGYSQVAWTAISEFGAAEGISHKYYKAAEASEESYLATIDTAVKQGAGIVIADGYSFESAVYKGQERYPEVKFVLIDGTPMDEETGKSQIGKNTMSAIFASEQAGYLAGYGAVKDGVTQLGFMGASKDPNTMDYGFGFLQGADRAAREQGVAVTVRYHYCTSDEDRQAILDRASQWYGAGTEAIFACGSRPEQPIIEAAELLEKKVIGFETDKSQMSDTVITSAVKDIGRALEEVLEQYKEDEFPAGKRVEYNAANDGIWLELENGRLTGLDKGDYNRIYDQLKDGDVTVKKHDSGDLASLGLVNVQVVEQ